ncbi:MAG TPA: cache domain-containing protein [Terriglobales bacterium]|nr:cache domain-containing protein [Terriglobales bacterium]
MRTYLLGTFLLVSVLPIVLLAIALTTKDANEHEREARGRVREASASIEAEVEQYLVYNRSAIVILAHLIEATPPNHAARFDVLRAHRTEYPVFYTMLVADANGKVLAADDGSTTGRDQTPANLPSVADREYFRGARDTDLPYISNAFMGRGFGRDPIVAISAPLHDANGKFTGIVEGSLDLRRFARFESRYRNLEGVEIVLLDGKDQVVYASSRSGLQALDVPTGSSMLKAAASAKDATAFYYERPESGGGVEYLTSQEPLAIVRWRVFVRQPVEVLKRDIRRNYLLSGAWAITAIVICFVLAQFASHRIVRPLGVLAGSVRDFQLSGESERIAVAAGAPREVSELVQGFEEMQARLGRSLQGLLPICSSCKKIRDEQGRWNPIETYIRSRSEADFSHGICPECAGRLYPDHYHPKA